MVIFPPVEPTQGTRNSNRRGTRRAAEVAAAAVVAVAISSGHEGSEAGQGAAGAGGAKREGGRGRLLGGEEEGGVDGGDGEGTEPGDARRTTSAAATAEAAAVGANGRRLPPLVPPKGDWAVAFAEGADSALAHGVSWAAIVDGAGRDGWELRLRHSHDRYALCIFLWFGDGSLSVRPGLGPVAHTLASPLVCVCTAAREPASPTVERVHTAAFFHFFFYLLLLFLSLRAWWVQRRILLSLCCAKGRRGSPWRSNPNPTSAAFFLTCDLMWCNQELDAFAPTVGAICFCFLSPCGSPLDLVPSFSPVLHVILFFNFNFSQPGLRSLKQGQQDRFGGQHPALMVVLPDIHLYWRISELLCEVRRRAAVDARAVS